MKATHSPTASSLSLAWTWWTAVADAGFMDGRPPFAAGGVRLSMEVKGTHSQLDLVRSRALEWMERFDLISDTRLNEH